MTETELQTMRRQIEELRRRPETTTTGGGGTTTIIRGTAVVVKILSNAAGGGKYNGRILTGDSTAVAAGTLNMPEGMTVPGADDALILNLMENGTVTHDLAVSGFHFGTTAGTSAGKTVVIINAIRAAC